MFCRNVEVNAITCNSMIGSCDQAGQWQRALDVFGLQKVQRIQLDAFTYSSVASACAKSSLVLAAYLGGWPWEFQKGLAWFGPGWMSNDLTVMMLVAEGSSDTTYSKCVSIWFNLYLVVLQCDSFRRQLSHIMTMMQIHGTTSWFQLDLQDCIRSTGESISKTCSSIAEKCVPDSSILATWYVPYLPMSLLIAWPVFVFYTHYKTHYKLYVHIHGPWSFLSFSSNLVGHTFEPPCRICSWHVILYSPTFSPALCYLKVAIGP